MKSGIKVTVVVPTHNTSRGALTGVQSLLSQTMPASEYEVIYVDDGSTDDTPDLIEHCAADRPNFRVVRSTNSGWPGRPRNIGIDQARGEFIFFADDDDWLEPEALERLYARAVTDCADIVIGRVVGHGRGTPRDLFRASLTGGDIRNPSHAVLLWSTTVHKLFRASFLRDNNLRFEEGKVRLEDHMFILSAFLRTQSVSILHDVPIYHWVRHEDFGNISFGRVDPVAYSGSVARIFEMINAEIDDPATRERFISLWYRRKLLRHIPQKQFTDSPFEFAEAIVAANRAVITKWVNPAQDDVMTYTLRNRARLLRDGETELLRRWGRFERRIDLATAVQTCRWQGGRLIVKFSADLVMKVDKITKRHVEFVRRDGRTHIVLPPELAALSPDATDVTREFPRSTVRLLVRKRQPTGDISVTTASRLIETPLIGSEQNHAGAHEERFGLRIEAEAALDPTTADSGRPLDGTWDLFVLMEGMGFHREQRLGPTGAQRIRLGSSRMVIAGKMVAPYLTKGRRNLSIWVGQGRRPTDERPAQVFLHKAVRRLRRVAGRVKRKALRG